MWGIKIKKMWCFKASFYLLLFICVSTKLLRDTEASKDVNTNLADTLLDLPREKDLLRYLKCLEKIFNYSINQKHSFDINFDFGLFLVDVNLKAVANARLKLPFGLQVYLSSLMKKTEIILNYHKREQTIFSDTTLWVNIIANMESSFQDEPVMKSVKPSWEKYQNNVHDFDMWRPSPQKSGTCLSSLAKKPIFYSTFSKCNINDECYDILINGTDFGYALTHRLLLLIIAKFDRSCSIFYPEYDESLRQKLCSTMYREAKYIVENDYQLVDLLLEQMCLCALDGNVEFLHRSWLAKILHFQTTLGCFRLNLTSITRPPRDLEELMEETKEDECNGHVTAVAAATLAIASRFILETYY